MLNIELVPKLQEIQENLTTVDLLEKAVKDRTVVIFKAKSSPVAIGKGMLVKVNTNIGISSSAMLAGEIVKLKALATAGYAPDTVMDHTVIRLPKKQFYEYMIEEFGGPIGTLPHYLAYQQDKGIDEQELLDIATRQAESGISFMTLHPTSTLELYDKARRLRSVPTSSRGGGILIRDMLLNNRKFNILEKVFPDLLRLFSKHNMAVSIGSTFRPANTLEALDEVHRDEIALQGEYITAARNAGVPVQLEGIGHVRFGQIAEYYNLIAKFQIPMMPLGPLPTDAAVGQDHIANAIGAAYAAWIGGAHIINSITREEHTGGVPTEESILEGLKAARIAAHSVNISRFPQIAQLDINVSNLRSSRTPVL